MAMNRVQIQPGLSMAEFLELSRIWEPGQVRSGSDRLALARGLCLPGMRFASEQLVSTRGTAVLAALRLPPPVRRYQRHNLRGDQVATDALVAGHAPAHAVQEQRRCPRTHAPPWRLLQDCLARQAQIHGGHARSRRLSLPIVEHLVLDIVPQGLRKLGPFGLHVDRERDRIEARETARHRVADALDRSRSVNATSRRHAENSPRPYADRFACIASRLAVASARRSLGLVAVNVAIAGTLRRRGAAARSHRSLPGPRASVRRFPVPAPPA